MNLSEGVAILVAVLVLVLASIQTYKPNFLSKPTSDALTAITIGLLGILTSCWVLLLFLRSRNREGFQQQDPMSRWKELQTNYKLGDVCSLYNDLYEKIRLVEQGPPGSSVSDAQAREKTDKRFSDRMTMPVLSCSKVDALSKASTLQALFETLQTVPDTLFVQAYQTANACRSLLQEQLDLVSKNQERTVEDFQDVPLCSPEIAKKRREANALQKAEQTKCVLPEEIDTSKLEDAINKKLTSLEDTFLKANVASKESLS